jgi:hypothetical protein
MIKTFFIELYFKIDPRTGKPSPLPAAQQELNQNGPLPVSQNERYTLYLFYFSVTLGSSNITGWSCLLY